MTIQVTSPMLIVTSSLIGIGLLVWRCGIVMVTAMRPCGHRMQGRGGCVLLSHDLICNARVEQGVCLTHLTTGQISHQSDGSIVQAFHCSSE